MSRSARSVSACELTETYSPAAIDSAPATKPATPASTTSCCEAAADATPTSRLAVDTMPSLAPSTAARSQPMRSLRWSSVSGKSRVVSRWSVDRRDGRSVQPQIDRELSAMVSKVHHRIAQDDVSQLIAHHLAAEVQLPVGHQVLV